MALFDNTAPLSPVAMPPSFFQGDSTFLKVLGYHEDGTKNTWGKILGWNPLLGLASNTLARRQFEGQQATDALANQQIAAQRDLQKGLTNINLGTGVAGALSGNPQLAMQGGIGAVRGFGQLLNPTQYNPYNPQMTFQNI